MSCTSDGFKPEREDVTVRVHETAAATITVSFVDNGSDTDDDSEEDCLGSVSQTSDDFVAEVPSNVNFIESDKTVDMNVQNDMSDRKCLPENTDLDNQGMGVPNMACVKKSDSPDNGYSSVEDSTVQTCETSHVIDEANDQCTGHVIDEANDQCTGHIIDEANDQCTGHVIDEANDQCTGHVIVEANDQCTGHVIDKANDHCTSHIIDEAIDQCTGHVIDEANDQCTGHVIDEANDQCTGHIIDEANDQCTGHVIDEANDQCTGLRDCSSSEYHCEKQISNNCEEVECSYNPNESVLVCDSLLRDVKTGAMKGDLCKIQSDEKYTENESVSEKVENDITSDLSSNIIDPVFSDNVIEVHNSNNTNSPELCVCDDNYGDQSPMSQRSNTSSDIAEINKTQRINPFDKDIFLEEDHFAQGRDILYSKRRNQRGLTGDQPSSYYKSSLSSSTDSWSDLSPYFQSNDDENYNFSYLGLTEDHFSQPEGVFGLSTTEELEMAIEHCKQLITEAGDSQQKKNSLVHKLVQLRMRLQEAREDPEETPEHWKLILGHRFQRKDSKSTKHYCEKCNTVIWGMLQIWYRCEICGFSCHSKCLNLITRMCAITKVTENPTYNLQICPEKGLAIQQYRCAECKTVISFRDGYPVPRQCDYTGGYYCETCHWNDSAIVPARVLHNWDFEPKRVCRASKQFLHLMSRKAVLRLQDINPMLFSFVDELQVIKKLREEILIMKKYIITCQEALGSKLLLQLQHRQHFVENSDMYSLRDMLDIEGDMLLPNVTKIHASFAQHIKTDCRICQAKGYICELCDIDEVLFPFDSVAIVCPSCSAVLHKHCFVRRGNKCPKCYRLSMRQPSP